MARNDDKNSRRTVSRDRVRGRAEEEKDNGGSSCIKLPDGVKFMETKEGTAKINIVPYEVQSYNHLDEVEKGDLWYRKKYFVHRGIGVENKIVVCLTTFGEPCPVCEYIAAAKKSGTGGEQELKDLKKKERAIYNVDNGKTIDLFDMSTFCFEQKLQEEIREGREEYADFPNLEGGFTLRVRFKEEVMGKNKFLEAGRIDFDPRDDYPDSILDEVVDLDACLVKLSYEALDKMFYGTATEGGRHEDGAGERGGRGSEREDRGGRESSRGGRSGGEDTGRGRGEKEESGGRSSGRGERGQDSSRGSERGGREEKPADDTRGAGRERSSRGTAAEPEKAAEDTGRGGRGGRGGREEAPADPPPAERGGRGGRGAAQEDKTPAKSDNKCPGGGKYGEDCDKLDHCATCPAETWEPCRDDTDAFLAANQPAGRGRK